MPTKPTIPLPPMRPNDFYILFVLLDGPLHGYRISKQIEQLSDGRVRLEAANLQRTIQKLHRMGLVEIPAKRPARAQDDPRRRYYAITELGHTAVVSEAERMRGLAQVAEVRQLIPRTGEAK
jgi:DNA-binding PadR family transcriptional regulator